MRRAMLRKSSYGGGFDFTTGLVAAWQYENNFNDYTGVHNAVATGSVTNNTAGIVGNEAVFGGTTDYLTAPNHADFSFGNGTTDVPFSIATWVNFTTFNAAEGVWLVNKRRGGVDDEWQFRVISKKLAIVMFDQSTGGYLFAEYDLTPIFSLLTDYHFAITYDGSGTFAGIKIYVNGSQVTTVDGSAGTYVAMEVGTSNVIIGTRAWVTNLGELHGSLDETKIYKNRELTALEISEMHTKELAGISVLP